MDITEQEKEILPQFRAQVSDVLKAGHDDLFLVRWLRARQHDMVRAEDMLRKSMAWRKETGADNILTTFNPPPVLSQYYPGGQCGYDKEGCPVVIDPIGKLDMRGVLYSVKRTDITKSIICKCETMDLIYKEQSKKLGKPISQAVQILDFDGFGRSHLWKPGADLFIDILSIVENNYPETLKKTFIINAPRLFNMCWAFVSQFVAEGTKNKFHFLGSNWKEVIQSELDTRELPVHWGGQATGPGSDPFCKHKICMGGKVPEGKYKSMESFFPEGIALKTVTVPANSPSAFVYKVEGDGSKALRYFFCTGSGSIGFGIYRKPVKREKEKLLLSELEVVDPVSSVTCDKVPHDGMCVCDRPGVYVLVFTNNSGIGSMFFSKELKFCVEIIDQTGLTNTAENDKEENINTNL